MFAFILGTSPIFFLIGLAASELFRKKAFVYLAAGFIAVMGILAINSGQLLRGSIHTLQNYWKILVETPEDIRSAKIVSGVQEVTIKVIDRGYEANINSLKVGVPVKLKLVTNGVRSCARAFTIPELNYFKVLPATGSEIIEFTPRKTGNLIYTCSMGMYTGSFNVVK